MASVLRVIRGPLQGSVYVLGDRTRIGRAVDAHIQLTDAAVSRHHARIVRRNDGSFHLADLSSKAGTMVDGKPIAQHALSATERITIGTTEFVFEERGDEVVDSSPRFSDKVRGFSVLRATECFMPVPDLRRSRSEPARSAPKTDTAPPARTTVPSSNDTDDVLPYAPGYAQHLPAGSAAPGTTREPAVRRPRRRATKRSFRALDDVSNANLSVRESWGNGEGPKAADRPGVVTLKVDETAERPAEPRDAATSPDLSEDGTSSTSAADRVDAPTAKEPPTAPALAPASGPAPQESPSAPTPQEAAVEPAPSSEQQPSSEPAAPEAPAPSTTQAVLVREDTAGQPMGSAKATPPSANRSATDVPRPRPSASTSSDSYRHDSPSGPHIGVGADPEARERGLTILREVLEYRDLRLRDLRGESLSSAKRARYESLQLRLMNTVDQKDLPGSRRYQRFSCSLPAAILQRDGSVSRMLDVELEDLSAGGARIIASDPAIRVGDELWLAFNLAALFSYGQKVVFRCRVVWTRPLHAKLGLMFGGTARFAATVEDATKDP